MTDRTSAYLVQCCLKRMVEVMSCGTPSGDLTGKTMIGAFLRGIADADCDFRTSDLDDYEGTLDYLIRIGLGRNKTDDRGKEYPELMHLDYGPQDVE